MQIKDLDRDDLDEPDGQDECSFLTLLRLLGGVLVINGLGIFLGICATDYRGNDPNTNENTPGLIVDHVSRRE